MKSFFKYPIGCIGLCAFTLFLTSCEKGWLEEKRDLNLVVPSSLGDMRGLLRNTRVFMYDGIGTGILSADGHYINDATLAGYTQWARKAYLWEVDMFRGELGVLDWDRNYQQVAYCNFILEHLAKITPTSSQEREWTSVKGAALFFRGKAFFNLAQLFAGPWPIHDGTPTEAPGIPLPLKADVNQIIEISSLEETYRRVEEDLASAANLLDGSPDQRTDASKRTAWAMLARLNLVMGRYAEALAYADSCLSLPYTLMDFNTLSANVSYPFVRFNDEVWLHSLSVPNFVVNVDTVLLASFAGDDLRKELYFREIDSKSSRFRGNYSGTSEIFTGIAANEVILIGAECLVREGFVKEGLQTMEELLLKRYREGTYTMDYTLTQQEALQLVLKERRKELLIRGLRWSDLRRLNQSPDTETTIERYVNGVHYELLPNDKRYTLPIPDYVTQ